MKSILAALLLTTAAPMAQAAVPDSGNASNAVEESAENAAQKAMDSAMSIFTKMFDTSDLPEPEAARLELATVTASKLLPNGAYAKIMDNMVEQILTPLFNIMPGLTDAQIVSATGASQDNVAALTEEQKAAVTRIIDPYHKQRAEQTIAIMKPMIAEAMAIVEPAMRTGLSRAYARKFSAAELTTINSFFATPTGSTFARESFALQADPEVLQATFKALPAIFTSFMGDEAKFKAKFEELPRQRELKDLSDTEMAELARQLGVSVKSLEDHRLIVTIADPYAHETGEEPWYAEDSWAAAERKNVKALETKYDTLSTRSEQAGAQSSAAYEAYEKAWQAAVDAARKRMLAEGWTPPSAEPETTEGTADSVEAVASL
ncbi:MAG: DUF2059 domain-containing protein [Sphingomonadaceae bacterium]|nr:DUF2059 domain-containing protein [Sphingomonadaceae bacterium]